MCGIVGYIGNKEALPILLGGLRRLEYRGYDSAGVAVLGDGEIQRIRAVGKVEALAERVNRESFLGTCGIGHTRWATHGGVTEANAHPHVSCDGKIALVHNGIIENYREIKSKLGNQHRFESDTDSEILAHLIESEYAGDLREAVRKALGQVRGTYGLAVIHGNHPGECVIARMGSPIVIGIGDDGHYMASDATPILPHTKRVVFLNDGEFAVINKGSLEFYTENGAAVIKGVEEILWNDETAEKHGYPHFMLKEIFDQPMVLEDAVRGRIDLENGTARLGGINMTEDEMRATSRVIFVACGTAYHAGLIGKYAFERLAGIPVETDVASEFRYRDPVLDRRTLVFAISQSGETADTLAAVREAKRRGAKVRGIINVIGSTIAREVEGGTYIHAGPELAVASTKAYTNMVAVILLYALQFGRLRGVSVATGRRMVEAIQMIPEQMRAVLALSNKIRTIAERYAANRDFLFLGRGVNFPVALEGSLKLKELSYIHSEAVAAGEMKHGTNALLGPEFPVFGIMTRDQVYEKMRSNIEEVRARGSRVILLATDGDGSAAEAADEVIYVPKTMELLQPLLNTIPLQLFAYHVAAALGRDVDRPRNLAKSVTVE